MTMNGGDLLTANGDLGVTVSLSADLADRLRQHQPPLPSQQQPKLSFLSKKKDGDSDDDSDDEEEEAAFVAPTSEDPLDDWNEELPGVSAAAAEEEEDAKEEENNDDDDDDTSVDSIDSDSPPPHMPVMVVDAARLAGYRPSCMKDMERQIHAALWYGSASNPDDDNNIQHDVEAAQHFDRRLTELLEGGVARHATTEEMNDETKPEYSVLVRYPEFLCTNGSTTVASTSKMWKQLLRRHPIAVVDTLLQKLHACNRTLVWKHAMHQELWKLAKHEEHAKQRRHQSQALREWKTTKRTHQLEQLYKVSETLQHRMEMANAKLAELEKARDQAVAVELRRRRVATGVGGLEALDLNSTILAFPDQDSPWLGLAQDEDDDDYYDDQIGPSFISDEDDDNDDHDREYDGGASDDGRDDDADTDDDGNADNNKNNNDEAATTTATETELPASFPRRRGNKARKAALAKRRRKRLEEAAKEAEHQSKLDRAKAEEVKIRELCTTNDLKLAQAIKAALQKKMESVDELLESLQEEVWADEEAQESGQPLIPGGEQDDNGASTNDGFSLLDQVLAMILGSFPPPTSSSSNAKENASLLAKHTQKLQQEHNQIVKDWKEHFGRLPTSLLVDRPPAQKPSQTDQKPSPDPTQQAELRNSYGIEDNDADDWDDADSDDDDEGENNHSGNEESPAPPRAPPKVGLRPGGKARR
ncbi:expressed unknown protein [Seminavis robusta]|uniref:Uncharacterized protein n=1 Tax=Seminavis robusta TaxID=568900 RepID=A0A9N8DBP8_9STRA|nr:expressed unknown protein [Seminavis robusta]|eukprot:Sro68_g038110.1 n/a (702) ;mRNA; f:60604-62709